MEISSNALDVIQVKDNGYGIAPVDRDLVCKRHCTSKITSFEDISKIGGRSLGFRGEALASAAEMSGSLILSTRVEGELTAASLKFNSQGSINVYVRRFCCSSWTDFINAVITVKSAYPILLVLLCELVTF